MSECHHIRLRYKWFRPVCGDCGIPLTIELLQELTEVAEQRIAYLNSARPSQPLSPITKRRLVK